MSKSSHYLSFSSSSEESLYSSSSSVASDSFSDEDISLFAFGRLDPDESGSAASVDGAFPSALQRRCSAPTLLPADSSTPEKAVGREFSRRETGGSWKRMKRALSLNVGLRRLFRRRTGPLAPETKRLLERSETAEPAPRVSSERFLGGSSGECSSKRGAR